MSQVSVNLVAEVDGSGTGSQLYDLALRSVYEHLVVENVLLYRLDEIVGSGHLPLPLQQLAQPGHLFFETQVAGFPFLVLPVGSYPVLGNLVQIIGFDLHLQGIASVAYHRGMQGLVQIFLGVGDVIIELAGDGMPELMDNAQGLIAVLQ